MAQVSNNGTSVDDLTSQIAVLRSDLADLTTTIKDLGRTKSAELSEAARRKGADTAEYVADRAREAHAQANDFVQAQPGVSLGIAAGAGFLVGLIASRR